MVEIRQPQMRITAGVRHDAIVGRGGRAVLHGDVSADYAGAGASRSTGFSTIGRLMIAESTPNSTESHHTTS